MKQIKKYILRKCLPFLCVPVVLSSCASESSDITVEEVKAFSSVVTLEPDDFVSDVIEEEYTKTTIKDLPEFYREQLEKIYDSSLGLDKLYSLRINVSNNEDLSWLGDCINLVDLEVNLVEKVNSNKLDVIGKLKNLESFGISCGNDYYYESEEAYQEALHILDNDPMFKVIVSNFYNDTGYYITVVNDVFLSDLNFDFLELLPNLMNINLKYVRYMDGLDFSWLTKVSNLTSLTLNLNYYKYLDLNPLLNVLLSLNNLNDLKINTNSCYVTPEEIDFINKITSVTDYCSFSFRGYSGCFFRYYNSDGKYILDIGRNDVVDFRSFEKLDCVNFDFVDIYNAAIYLTQEDLNYLRNNNIEILVGKGHTLEDLEAIVQELDEVCKSLDIDDSMSEQEKLDKVLQYIIKTYSYDYNFRENGYSCYYYEEKGYIYGALEGNKIICGNYAALLNALLYRLGIDSYYIFSFNHAWNLVRIDENYYYVDACWIDDEDNSFLNSTNYNEDYSWYMALPDMAQELDSTGSHACKIFPSWVEYGESRIRKK